MKKGKVIFGVGAMFVAIIAIMALMPVTADENAEVQEKTISYWGIDYKENSFDIGLRNRLNTAQEREVVLLYNNEEVGSNFTAYLPANSTVTYPVEVEMEIGRYAVFLDSEMYDAIGFWLPPKTAQPLVYISYLGIDYDENLFDIYLKNDLYVPAIGKVIIYRRKVEVCSFTAIVPENTEIKYTIPVETSSGGACVVFALAQTGAPKSSRCVKLHCSK